MFVLYCARADGKETAPRPDCQGAVLVILSVVSDLNRLDLLDQGLGIRVEVLQRLHRLVREAREAIDAALRELERQTSAHRIHHRNIRGSRDGEGDS